MTDERNYLAVITFSLPGADESTSITVTLAPASSVVAGGRVKPLRDCTLADLQEFAGNLEAEIWADYQAIRLLDLAESSPAAVEVAILQPNGRPAATPESWQDHLVILPEERTGTEASGPTARTQEPAQATTPAPEAPEKESSAGTEEPVEASTPEPATTGDPAEAATPAHDAAGMERSGEAPSASEASTPDPEAPAPVALPERRVETAAPAAEPVPAERPQPWPRELRIAGRRRPLGHPTWTAVDILINEPAFRDCQTHALSSLDREVAGVLVGPPPEKQPDGRYVVHVTDSIIARHTRMHGASVTYTPESWRYVTDRLAELYPDESAVMVGWYHTHPGFGIFLSSMDLFIHQNFFTQLWHVALVLDPIARRSGFFCWDRAKSQVKPYDFPWPSWANGSW
jgi:proteasome lid subunit RPN8/RPN11